MATPIPSNQAAFSLAEVAAITGGRLHGADGPIRGVVTDSRQVEPGNLFVALSGERFDGHRFVGRAAADGAAGVLVSEPVDVAVPFVLVADTTRALGDLAAAVRRRWGGTVVAITGSAGKTGTKEFVAAALRSSGRRVLATVGNLNNRIGVPATLFQLSSDHDVAVIEAGTSEPGEIARLAEIIGPDVSVVTLVAPAHTEGLGTLQDVAEEKVGLLRAIGPGGVAIYNGNSEALRPLVGALHAGKSIAFGTGEHCAVELVTHRIEEDLRMYVEISVLGESVHLHLGLLGEGAALNATATAAVLHALGMPLETGLRALEGVGAVSGRMVPMAGIEGSLVIDDTYNANPRSMDVALAAARAVADHRGARLVAVLGEMGELGDLSRDHHVLLAESVAAARAEVFVGCGEAMADATKVASSLGVPQVAHVADSLAAAKEVLARLSTGDVILVKGSRFTAMERVVDALVPGRSTYPSASSSEVTS